MNTLFSPDSKFMLALNRIADLVVLNLCFLLTCIPIVTIGAASTAMYTVCFRIGTGRETGIFRSYFRAFRDNFKQSTALWLLELLLCAATCVNIYLCYHMSGTLHYMFILFLPLLALVLLVFSYAFPLLSQFENTILVTFKNALALSLGYLPRTLLITVLNIFPFVLMFTNLYLFYKVFYLWIVLYFSAAAYLNTLLLKKVFAPYMVSEKEDAQ